MPYGVIIPHFTIAVRHPSARAIARIHKLSANSVRDHVTAIFTKLGAASRAEAVAIAFRKHLLKI